MKSMALGYGENIFSKDEGCETQCGKLRRERESLVQERMRCSSRVAAVDRDNAEVSRLWDVLLPAYQVCRGPGRTLLDRDAGMPVTIVPHSSVHSSRQACRHLHILEVRQNDGSRGRMCTRDQGKTETPSESERKVAGQLQVVLTFAQWFRISSVIDKATPGTTP